MVEHKEVVNFNLKDFSKENFPTKVHSTEEENNKLHLLRYSSVHMTYPFLYQPGINSENTQFSNSERMGLQITKKLLAIVELVINYRLL